MQAISIGLGFLALAITTGIQVMIGSAPQFLLLISAFFGLCGIMSFMWFPKLKTSGPYLYKNHPRFNHWRMKVHNEGPAGAVNVQMRLRNIDPPPRYPIWGADYPYPVQLVGIAGNPQFSCRVNQNNDAVFEIVSGWSNNGEFFTRGLDTKTNDTPIRIENGERWVLKYDIIADNATSINFSVEMFVDVESRAVMVRRKN
jgi:hypothetical protein